jgi:hypothetical protein
VENWTRQEERKRSKKRKKRGDGIQTAELDRRDQVTAAKSWPSSLRKGGTEVDNQVAVATESSIPNLHRATIAQHRVRMAGWRQRRLGSTGKTLHPGGKRKTDRKRKIDLTLTGLLM